MYENLPLIFLIIFAGALIQSFSGFGFSLLTIPLLSFVIEIKEAIALSALCSMVINIYLFIRLHEHIKFNYIKYLVIGAIIGTPIGVYFLHNVSGEILKICLSVLIMFFVFFSSFKIKYHLKASKNAGYFFGLLAGIFGGSLNTNGPPIMIYLLISGWDKMVVKASIACFFTIAAIFIILSHIISGITTVNILIIFLYVLPVIFLGIFIGTKLFDKISTKFYNKIILGALSIISLLLLL